MTPVNWITYFFVLAAGISALSILFIKNLFHAALLLMITLLCVAAIYILCYAEFLAVSQILIYAGGVVVIILFGIMLTSRGSNEPLEVENTNTFFAVCLGSALLYVLGHVLYMSYADVTGSVIELDSVTSTGLNLMTSHLLAFEVAGILLLIALIGAAVISSFEQDKRS
jgi:NADH:ubiquinone oxidoreductase subunit 6 (subunit J)